MSFLEQFVDFLKNQKREPSFSTIKNYKADVDQFINWLEKEFKHFFDPAKITPQIIEQYKNSQRLSPSSVARHLSSLRKFFAFLKLGGIIPQDPLEKATVSAEALVKEDPYLLKNFKSFLYEYKKSALTIKNYLNDLKSFFAWLKEVSLIKYAWRVQEKDLLTRINSLVVNEYKERLIAFKFSPLTINRKLSSLRNYIKWAKRQRIIPENSEYSENQIISISESQKVRHFENMKLRSSDSPSSPSVPKYSSFPPARLIQKTLKGANLLFDNLFILPLAEIIEDIQYLFWKVSGKKIFKKYVILNEAKNLHGTVRNIQKEFYAPLSISTHYLPWRKRVWHYLRHVRPNWYKKYHSYSITHYFHFAILVILSCAIGFGIYQEYFANAQEDKAVLGAAADSQTRVLSFQGKLADSRNNPIVKATDITFSIYNTGDAPETASIWQETNLVKPDSNGSFSVLLGQNAPIANSLFSQNPELFMGIKIGETPELSPRQQLATIPLADNTEALQGLAPITNSSKANNVILALDSSGNLNMADSKTHTFQAIGGNFVLSGSILSLVTIPGSNGNVEITPDGLGKIDLTKPIQNSTNNNNLLTVPGAVEFDDLVTILATSSAYSAFTINQNSIGPLISASASGIAKFTVDNDGTGIFAGDVRMDGKNLISTSTTFNLLESGVTTLNIGGSATTINIGSAGAIMNFKPNLNVKGDLSLSKLTSNGGILYTNESGKVFQASAGSSSDCLMGGSTPSFSSCSGINTFDQTNGTIYTKNNTMDVLFGGSSSSSAKMAFININSGTPTASISGDLTLNSAGIIRTTNSQTLTIGDSGTGTIAFTNGGNVGIGTTNPSRKLDVSGDINYTGTLYKNGIADFAEYVRKDSAQIIPYGSLICLNSNGLAVPCDSNNGKIIGVASERPAFLGGENLGDSSIAVGLIGQVETLVAVTNGEIKAGDSLTASDIPGVAVKASKAGQVVGKALEDLNKIDEARIAGYYDPDNQEYRDKAGFPDIVLKPSIIRVFKIYALVNVSWHDPDIYLTSTGNLSIDSNLASQGEALEAQSYSLKTKTGEIIEKIGAFAELAVANLKAGLVKAEKIVTQSLIVTSDSLIVNGQNLKDYIINVVQESPLRQGFGGQARIVSPVVSTEKLATDIISPLSDDSQISVSLHDSQFIIHDSANASGSAVAVIDNAGNASFSGQLQTNQLLTNQLTTNDASISGTLKAGNIFANSIEGLTSFMNIASYSGQFAYVEGLAAEQAQFNRGLMVFGATSLMDISVSGQLSIGSTMFLTANSVETLGADLSLQSLKQGGLSVMGGLVYIDTDGNLKVQGNVAISGKLDVKGDIAASGSGTFTKLNFSLIQPALAVSPTELIASSSAGIANISSYQTEVTIRNGLVTDKSVIYITPVGTPSAQTPFLMRQVPDQPALPARQSLGEGGSGAEGSFTVGVQSPTFNPIPFNWLIVN